MMEKLEAPQTYIALKQMIKEVDEDADGEISFREVSNILYLCKKSRLTVHALAINSISFDLIIPKDNGTSSAQILLENLKSIIGSHW